LSFGTDNTSIWRRHMAETTLRARRIGDFSVRASQRWLEKSHGQAKCVRPRLLSVELLGYTNSRTLGGLAAGFRTKPLAGIRPGADLGDAGRDHGEASSKEG
jgi:hypothetical protein